jgi:hypothetical protein
MSPRSDSASRIVAREVRAEDDARDVARVRVMSSRRALRGCESRVRAVVLYGGARVSMRIGVDAREVSRVRRRSHEGVRRFV